MAYREAAAWLNVDVDRNDLDDGLSEEDADAVRDFIRNEIVPLLEKKGQTGV